MKKVCTILAAVLLAGFPSFANAQRLSGGGTGLSKTDSNSYPATGGTASIPQQQRAGWRLTPQDFGAKCDYNFNSNTGTDDTTAISNWIAAIQSGAAQGSGVRGYVPNGGCLTGPQTISGQIEFTGASEFSSVFVLKSGSTSALFTFLTTGNNFPASGYPQGHSYIGHIRTISQDGYTQSATYPNAHAFAFPAGGAWSEWVYLDHVTIYNIPGDGVYGANFNGFVKMDAPYIQQVGAVGIDTNSTVDWVINAANVSVSHGDSNIRTSGDTSITYHNLNSFSAVGAGVHVFGHNKQLTFTGHTEINLNQNGGLYLDHLQADALVTVNDVVFGANSQTHAANYSDVWSSGGIGGIVRIDKALFNPTFSVNNGYSSNYNVQFNTSTDTVTCFNCVFQNGTWFSSSTTNETTHQYFRSLGGSSGDPSTSSYTVATLPSTAIAGMRATVTDASACATALSAVAGGGATFCPVIYNGSAWVQNP